MENALYHGIIPTCDSGIIKISIFTDPKYLFIRISDDGIGMTPTDLEKIWTIKPDSPFQSLGLRGTIERMQIFYETQDICTIDSQPNKGTTITFSIPLDKTEKQNEEHNL